MSQMNKKYQGKKVQRIKKEEKHAKDMKIYNGLLKQKEKEEENKKFILKEKKEIRKKQKEAAKLEEMEAVLL